MMIWFEVVSLKYTCAGAIKVLGISFALASFPPSLHPVLAVIGVCQPEHKIEIFAMEWEAKKRFREIGPGAQLFSCKGFRCIDVPVTWVTEPSFKEVRPWKC